MRVLIVDDHPIVVSGCRALLGVDPAIEVIDASDGETGYSAYFADQPDVAVIDINLPGVSGLELCRRILQRDPEARLIIFSNPRRSAPDAHINSRIEPGDVHDDLKAQSSYPGFAREAKVSFAIRKISLANWKISLAKRFRFAK